MQGFSAKARFFHFPAGGSVALVLAFFFVSMVWIGKSEGEGNEAAMLPVRGEKRAD